MSCLFLLCIVLFFFFFVVAKIKVCLRFSGQPAMCLWCHSTNHVVKNCPLRRKTTNGAGEGAQNPPPPLPFIVAFCFVFRFWLSSLLVLVFENEHLSSMRKNMFKSFLTFGCLGILRGILSRLSEWWELGKVKIKELSSLIAPSTPRSILVSVLF